jgi:hypothetical protein
LMNFVYIIYLDMRIVELTIWHREHLVNVRSKNFHVEAKPMLGSKTILFRTKPDGPTGTPASQTATQVGQTARV